MPTWPAEQIDGLFIEDAFLFLECELDRIIDDFDINSLIACYRNGLTFNIAKAVFENNTKRYDRLVAKLHEPHRAGFVRFNAFVIDYNRYRRNQLAAATDKARGHEK